MVQEEEVFIEIKHVRKDKTERAFKGSVIKEASGYKLVRPDRVLFVQLVNFAVGKGPKDYIQSYADADNELKKKYGKTRCEMDVHEIATFLTLGEYDMAVLWDAPNLETYQRVVVAIVNPSNDFGSSNTLLVAASMTHG